MINYDDDVIGDYDGYYENCETQWTMTHLPPSLEIKACLYHVYEFVILVLNHPYKPKIRAMDNDTSPITWINCMLTETCHHYIPRTCHIGPYLERYWKHRSMVGDRVHACSCATVGTVNLTGSFNVVLSKVTEDHPDPTAMMMGQAEWRSFRCRVRFREGNYILTDATYSTDYLNLSAKAKQNKKQKQKTANPRWTNQANDQTRSYGSLVLTWLCDKTIMSFFKHDGGIRGKVHQHNYENHSVLNRCAHVIAQMQNWWYTCMHMRPISTHRWLSARLW